MKIFNTLLDAAEFAATLCRNWSFATADERYNAEGLLTLAEISDSEDQLTRTALCGIARRSHRLMRGRRGH